MNEFFFTAQGGMVMYLFFITILSLKYSYFLKLILEFLVTHKAKNGLFYFKLPVYIS